MLMFSGRSCRFFFTISQRNRFVIHWEKTAGEGSLITPGTRRTSAAAGGKEFFGKAIFCENDLKQEKKLENTLLSFCWEIMKVCFNN